MFKIYFMILIGCISNCSTSSLRGRSPKQSIDIQYTGLLRLTARNDDYSFYDSNLLVKLPLS